MVDLLRNIGSGLRPIDDPFFEDSYRICKVFQRKGVTVEDDEELCHNPIKEFPCYAAGCKERFHTLLDYEMHYNTAHRYVCAECRKSMQNPRLLDIHIQETHDSFFKVLSLKQPMYQCYVSECNLKFNDPSERRKHCVGVHQFPKNFRFGNTSNSKVSKPEDKMEMEEANSETRTVKSRKVQLNKNQKSKMFVPAAKSSVLKCSQLGEARSNPSDTDKNASSLIFIPRQVPKSYTKMLTNNKSSERNVLETGSMMDLGESLPK